MCAKVLILLILTGARAFTLNFLAGGFEGGQLSPWYNSHSQCEVCGWAVDARDAHSGNYSAFNDGDELMKQDFVPLPTSEITVSFWARHPNASFGASLEVMLVYSDTTTTLLPLSTSGSAWEQFDITSSLAFGKSLTGFGVFGKGGTLTRIDDAVVDLNLVPEPSPLVLLFSGIAVIGIRRVAGGTGWIGKSFAGAFNVGAGRRCVTRCVISNRI